MSKTHVAKIKCPKCGRKNKALLWDSINTVINPEMKEKVRTGEAFVWICPECGYHASLNYAMLYHQMEDEVMIYYVPGNPKEAAEMVKGFFHDDIAEKIGRKLRFNKNYQKRVVGTMNQLQEKLMILDAGLDDRIIELMKLFMTVQLQEKEPDLRIEECLFERTEDGARRFVLNLGEGRWGESDYIQDIYDRLAEEFRRILSGRCDDIVVDSDWALGV